MDPEGVPELMQQQESLSLVFMDHKVINRNILVRVQLDLTA